MGSCRLRVTAAALFAASCGPGDNSAVRAFHPSVKPGMQLADAVVAGEKAQAYDIVYSVSSDGCPGDDVQVARHNHGPTVRITHPPADAKRPWERSYSEVGFANREEFSRGLAPVLAPFYSCRAFRFTFGRYQGWPNSDSFTVTIDAQGRITSVTELQRDRVD